MRTSCVSYPEKEPLILIRRSQLALCDDNHCAAALLSFFEHWHNIKLAQQSQAEHANRVAMMHGEAGEQDTTLLQYHTEDELEEGMLRLYGRTMIRRALAMLVQKEFVSLHNNPNSRYHFDKTHYFLFHPEKVSSQLLDISHEVKVTDGEVKSNAPCVKNTSSSGKSNASSPELSSELSSQDLNQDLLTTFVSTHACATASNAPLATETRPSPKPRTKASKIRTDYTPGFLLWWNTYPADRRTAKPECFTAWLTHDLERRTAELVEKLERLVATAWDTPERKYVKTALPYLNSGRYEDDLHPWPQRQASRLSASEQLTAEASRRILEEDGFYDSAGTTSIFTGTQRHGRRLL